MRAKELVPTVLSMVGLITLYSLMPFGGRWSLLTGVIGIVSVLAVIPFIVRRLGRIQTSVRPIYDAVQVAAVSLTVLVLGFSAAYESLSTRSGNFDGIDGKVDAVYFVVTTLGTVGYGDIHAVSKSARLVVTFQIIFNLVFLGGVVRVIANAGRERHKSLHGNTVEQVIAEQESGRAEPPPQ